MPEAEFVNIIPVAAYDISEEKVIPSELTDAIENMVNEIGNRNKR